ncbi:hypothetical protein ACIGXM_14605 [Kitasatospora sp. NPDC052896]|uniref:hypothetical protein n=1 Tax=Kitasatospora sp. NPDC052896 TaxID=3364061 RepID=UPI0037C8B2FB
MAVEFEASALVHSSPAGLAYVAAVYEEMSAEAESERDWADEGKHAYAMAASESAFWAYEELREESLRAGMRL